MLTHNKFKSDYTFFRRHKLLLFINLKSTLKSTQARAEKTYITSESTLKAAGPITFRNNALTHEYIAALDDHDTRQVRVRQCSAHLDLERWTRRDPRRIAYLFIFHTFNKDDVFLEKLPQAMTCSLCPRPRLNKQHMEIILRLLNKLYLCIFLTFISTTRFCWTLSHSDKCGRPK